MQLDLEQQAKAAEEKKLRLSEDALKAERALV